MRSAGVVVENWDCEEQLGGVRGDGGFYKADGIGKGWNSSEKGAEAPRAGEY
jgi:hypothetical protein